METKTRNHLRFGRSMWTHSAKKIVWQKRRRQPQCRRKCESKNVCSQRERKRVEDEWAVNRKILNNYFEESHREIEMNPFAHVHYSNLKFRKTREKNRIMRSQHSFLTLFFLSFVTQNQSIAVEAQRISDSNCDDDEKNTQLHMEQIDGGQRTGNAE